MASSRRRSKSRRRVPRAAIPATPWAHRKADDDYGVSATPDWRQVDWRAHLRSAQIDGRRVNYVDIGDGQGTPVILVHGLSGQWQNWLENIPRISQEHRVIAPDLPGFGLSEPPQWEISISRYARCVEALRERLDLEQVHMVGNSMGGFIAAEVAIQFAAGVERLVLVSAAGLTGPNVYRAPVLTGGRVAAVLTAVTTARHRAMARRPVARHAALALVARHPARLRPDVAWEALMKGAGKPGFHDALRACLEYDFRHRLPEISCPTLIFWGEKDAVLPLRDADEFERLIPDSRKVVMTDTGHVPQLERPAVFNRTLLEFLATSSEQQAAA
ncbi:MAG: alpha/beta fold hydrolase [Solirubrobacteraceae bacterium]|jgi:pimeloyl-ACP methyl ester carboxylesterase